MLITANEVNAECIWGSWADSSGGSHYCPPDCGGNPECNDTGTPQPYKAIAKGNARYEVNDYSGAIVAYTEALRYCRTDCDHIHKNIAYAQRNLESDRGNKLFDKKEIEGAIAAYKSALRYCRSDMDCDYLRKKISDLER